MYLSNDDFERWMEKLSKKLDEIGKDLKTIVNTNEVFGEDEKLLDNQDLCLTLHISKRTLQRYRSKYGLIKHFYFFVGFFSARIKYLLEIQNNIVLLYLIFKPDFF